MFAAATCRGSLLVQAGGGTPEVALGIDEPVVAASTIKVLIALAAESAFAAGHLDPTRPVHLGASDRTPGPVGFSLYLDDITVSRRDLVSAMMTISDNVAADRLLDLVGLDTCNRLAADMGLAGTLIVSNLAVMIEEVAQEAGLADWAAMTIWAAAKHSTAEREDVDRRIRQSAALDPTRATRTTARDMCRLLELIWTDRAGPASACASVRAHVFRQLTRQRLTTGFPTPARVAAKSGGLFGVVRNEVGVIEVPERSPVYAAVFTTTEHEANEEEINAVIGRAAAAAAESLRVAGNQRCAAPSFTIPGPPRS